MAYLSSARAMTGPAANLAPTFADLERLKTLPGVSKLALMHPDYVTVSDGRIASVINHADLADPFVNTVSGRGPTFDLDADLGRQTAAFDVPQDKYLTSAAPFSFSGAYTIATVCRVAQVPNDIFQSVIGDFSGTAAQTASIVVQNSGGVNRLVHRAGVLPGGASYARAEYVGGTYAYALATSDGVSRTAFRLGRGAFDRQDMSALPDVGVTEFRIGHNIANSSFEGAVDFVIGIEGVDYSQTAEAGNLALLDAFVHAAYGTLV